MRLKHSIFLYKMSDKMYLAILTAQLAAFTHSFYFFLLLFQVFIHCVLFSFRDLRNMRSKEQTL